jgi:Leucine-rich repeat (LRR) protein
MEQMFRDVSAFDQDLGWCVDSGVDVTVMFTGAGCEATACGVTFDCCNHEKSSCTAGALCPGGTAVSQQCTSPPGDGSTPGNPCACTALQQLVSMSSTLSSTSPWNDLGNKDYCGESDCDSFVDFCVLCATVNGLRMPQEIESKEAGFAGGLPESVGDLGPQLESLELEELSSSDGITGALPVEIGLLTGLWILNLNSNQITSVPSSIGDLVNLRHLDLGFNSIQAVPAEIGQLDLLQFSIQANQLTSVPDSFRTFNPQNLCMILGNPGFSCVNVLSESSCCTTQNCGDTSTCYTPPP